MNGIRTALPSFRVAAAELPSSFRVVEEHAVVVAVAGAPGWADEAGRVIDRGARVVVVDAPHHDAGDVSALAARRVPVTLSRPALRADDAHLASTRSPTRAITVEAHSPRGHLATTLADAVGWARVLGGGHLDLRSTSASGVAVLADLSGPSCDVALVASERSDPRGVARLRATTLAAERVDVLVEGSAAQVTRSSAEGDLRVARRWESPARLALRRAAAALHEGGSDDLADWCHDSLLAHAILHPRVQPQA